ncbi:MAG: DUF1788 domain-containing protein [Flavobacteriaceae bacterium]|nr:DUF1788 domain-containing protein [Flavobacteriaceae bacterium]
MGNKIFHPEDILRQCRTLLNKDLEMYQPYANNGNRQYKRLLPLFVSIYSPKDEIELQHHLHYAKNKLRTEGYHITEIKLFQSCLEILENEVPIEDIIEFERESLVKKNSPKKSGRSNKEYVQYHKNDFLDWISGVLCAENMVSKIESVVEVYKEETDLFVLSELNFCHPFVSPPHLFRQIDVLSQKHPTLLLFPGKEDIYSSMQNLSFLGLEGTREYKNYKIIGL